MRAQDFLLGLREFFSILIPGAVFLSLIQSPTLKAAGVTSPEANVFGFAVAAYLVGSVLAAIGSLLDLPVDAALESESMRVLMPRKFDEREQLAKSLGEQAKTNCSVASGQLDFETNKSFWWTHLRLNRPSAIAELDRLEAVQKLFRSLAIVFATLWIAPEALGLKNAVSPDVIAASGIISLLFYIGGRFRFLDTLFRLSAATCVSLDLRPKANPEDGRSPPAEPAKA